MSLANTERVLTDVIITQFGLSNVAYTLDNAPDAYQAKEGVTEVVECSINFLSSNQVTLGEVGSRVFRRTGDIVCRIYTEKDKGTRRSKELLDILLNIFEGNSFSGIVTQDISFLEIGPVGDRHLTTVRIPFYYNIEDI